MDWTGGTRRRFAGAKNNNTALQKQKAHFAKARAAVQHEPFTGHQGASAVAHNDDTRGSSRGSTTARNSGNTSTNKRQAQSIDSIVNAQVHGDEELLLIARRRKLLARNDWLALDPTRPLRIGFSTTNDKNDIGRRKKIKRSSATGPKAAHRRLLTPLFEERLEPTAHLLSGALPPAPKDNIEVKVGTSAFDNQSRPSRKSNTPRNLSVGPQSTILSHLSEESMLLGADGGTFDADQVDLSAYVRDERDSREDTVRPLSLGSEDRYNEEDAFPTREENSPTQSDSSRLLRAWNYGEVVGSTANLPPRPGQTIDGSLTSYLPVPESNIWDADETQPAHDFEHTDRNRSAASHAMTNPADLDAAGIDAEKAWRQLMGIATQSESFTSNKALDSSSDHMTTSETVRRSFPGVVQRAASLDVEIALTPQVGRSSLDDIDLGSDLSISNQSHATRGHNFQATSAESPNSLPGNREDNTDNEALWREFIIGSQDSESGDDLHSAWQRSRERTQQSSELPRSLQLSGLGTSDHATRGEVVIASPTLYAITDTGVDYEPGLRENSVEDDPLELMSTLSSPRNIHVTSAKKRNNQRSERPREQVVDTTHKKDRPRTRALCRGA